jgi:hypothetical protein
MGLSNEIDGELTKLCKLMHTTLKRYDKATIARYGVQQTKLNEIAGAFLKMHHSTYRRAKEHTDKLVKELTQLAKEVAAISKDLQDFKKAISYEGTGGTELFWNVEKEMQPAFNKLNKFASEKVEKPLKIIKQEKQKIST